MKSNTLTNLIIAGWSGFGISHLIMSHPPIRASLIENFRKGFEQKYSESPPPTTSTATSPITLTKEELDMQALGKFLGTYTLISFAFFVPTIALYSMKRSISTKIRSPGMLSEALATALNTSAIVVIGQSFVKPTTPSVAQEEQTTPKDVAAFQQQQQEEARGIKRISRHPLFLGLGLFGLGQMARAQYIADIAFYSFFPLFFVIGGTHQDYRHRLDQIHPKSYYDQTSLLPFGAIVEGRNSASNAFSEFHKIAVGGSLAAGLAIKLGMWKLRQGKNPFARSPPPPFVPSP